MTTEVMSQQYPSHQYPSPHQHPSVQQQHNYQYQPRHPLQRQALQHRSNSHPHSNTHPHAHHPPRSQHSYASHKSNQSHTTHRSQSFNSPNASPAAASSPYSHQQQYKAPPASIATASSIRTASIVPSLICPPSDIASQAPSQAVEYSRPSTRALSTDGHRPPRSSSLVPRPPTPGPQAINVTTEISSTFEDNQDLGIPPGRPDAERTGDAPDMATGLDHALHAPTTDSDRILIPERPRSVADHIEQTRTASFLAPPTSEPEKMFLAEPFENTANLPLTSQAQAPLPRPIIPQALPLEKKRPKVEMLEPRSGGFAIQRAPLTGRGPFSQLQEFKLSDSSHYFEYARSRHLNHDIHRLLQEEQPPGPSAGRASGSRGLSRSASTSILRNKAEPRRWSSRQFEKILHHRPTPPSNVVIAKTTDGRKKYARIVTDEIENPKPDMRDGHEKADESLRQSRAAGTWTKLGIDDAERARIADNSTYNVNRINRTKAKRSTANKKPEVEKSSKWTRGGGATGQTGKKSRFAEDVRRTTRNQRIDEESSDDGVISGDDILPDDNLDPGNSLNPPFKTFGSVRAVNGNLPTETKTPPPVLDPLPKTHSLHFDPLKFPFRNVLADVEAGDAGSERPQDEGIGSSGAEDSSAPVPLERSKSKMLTASSMHKLAQGMRRRSKSPTKRRHAEVPPNAGAGVHARNPEDIDTSAPQDTTGDSSRFQQHIHYLKDLERANSDMDNRDSQAVGEGPEISNAQDSTIASGTARSKNEAGPSHTYHAQTPSGGSMASVNYDTQIDGCTTISDAKSGKVYPGSARKLSNATSTSIPYPGPAPSTALPAVPEWPNGYLPSTPTRDSTTARISTGEGGLSNKTSPEKYAAFPRVSPARNGRPSRSPNVGDFPNPPESPAKASPNKSRRYAMIATNSPAPSLPLSDGSNEHAKPEPTKISRAEKVANRKARDIARQVSQNGERVSNSKRSEPRTVTQTTAPNDSGLGEQADTRRPSTKQTSTACTTDSHSSLEVVTAYSEGHGSGTDTTAPSTVSKHDPDEGKTMQMSPVQVMEENKENQSPTTSDKSITNGIPRAHDSKPSSNIFTNLPVLTEEEKQLARRSMSTSIIPTPALQRCLDRVPTPYKHDLFRRSSNRSSQRSSMTEASVEARLSRLEMSNKMLVKAFMAVVEATAEMSVSEQEELEGLRERELHHQRDQYSTYPAPSTARTSVDYRLSQASNGSGKALALAAASPDTSKSAGSSAPDQAPRYSRPGLDQVLASIERTLPAKHT